MQIEGIDEIDNKILEIIKDNARLTYKEIGEKVGISRVSVKTRMDVLQEKGIIKGGRKKAMQIVTAVPIASD